MTQSYTLHRVAGASVETLRRVPLFAELEADELQLIADAMHARTFHAGETVTAQGVGADGFYVVESGEAEVTVDGQQTGRIESGDYFGEIALLMGSERTATITALSDLHCFGITPVEFRALVEGNPAIAWNLVQSMMEKLS